MHTGTVCDIDPCGQFGLIEADDGQIVCFNQTNVFMPIASNLRIGARVAFFSDNYATGSHVNEVRLWSTQRMAQGICA